MSASARFLKVRSWCARAAVSGQLQESGMLPRDCRRIRQRRAGLAVCGSDGASLLHLRVSIWYSVRRRYRVPCGV